MQTLVAFAFDGPAAPGRVQQGLDRVEHWYAPLWGTTPCRHRAEAGAFGLALWEDPADPARWPTWSTAAGRTVATLHVPLGTDELGLDRGLPPPLALAARLRARPADVHRLPPPFVLAELDAAAHRLQLFTDGLGLGRLHELRTAEGSFWSNRPVAALRFAGVRAEADPQAWARMAACDWAMGDRTPYAGVEVVPAATQITADRSRVSRCSLDVLAGLVERRVNPLTTENLDRTAAALTAMAVAVSTTWPAVPVLSLSGGRDSRLVAAAFLAAGRPLRLRTYGGLDGEGDAARRLVALLPTAVEHEVTVPKGRPGQDGRAGAYERARRWHDSTEGMRPAVYLRSDPPLRLLRHHRPLVTGIGGEFAHAPGYPDDVESLERLPLPRRLEAWTRALQAKVTLPRGVAPDAMEATVRQIRAVIEHAADRDVTDAKALDWFYADERLRRWGMAGESPGRVLPLLVGEFVSASLGLSTAASRAGALHTALIERLLPQWAEIPYYTASLRERQARPQPRPWEEPDRDLLAEVLHQPDRWGEHFDVPRVQAVWGRAGAGRAGPRDELLLQRVVWRAAFGEHLAAVNAEVPAPGARATPPTSPTTGARPAARRATSPVLALATWANEVPWARRLARTALGRWLRRAIGV